VSLDRILTVYYYFNVKIQQKEQNNSDVSVNISSVAFSSPSSSSTVTFHSTHNRHQGTAVAASISRQKKHQILLWNRLPGRMDDILGTDSEGFFRQGCEFTNCYVTSSDRNKRPIHTYDAVVFNMNVLYQSGTAPWTVQNFTRNGNQRYVFFSQEPPM